MAKYTLLKNKATGARRIRNNQTGPIRLRLRILRSMPG